MKATTLEKKIKRNNAAYNKATPAQRRVMIAKDALDQIKRENIIPTPGLYVRPWADIDPDEQLQKVLLDDREPMQCDCCAKGTLFISCVRLSNRYQGSPRGIGSGGINELVAWPEANYHLIEAVFEGYNDAEYNQTETKWVNKWLDEHPTAELRMVEILKNIIRNNGLFKIKDL